MNYFIGAIRWGDATIFRVSEKSRQGRWKLAPLFRGKRTFWRVRWKLVPLFAPKGAKTGVNRTNRGTKCRETRNIGENAQIAERPSNLGTEHQIAAGAAYGQCGRPTPAINCHQPLNQPDHPAAKQPSVRPAAEPGTCSPCPLRCPPRCCLRGLPRWIW